MDIVERQKTHGTHETHVRSHAHRQLFEIPNFSQHQSTKFKSENLASGSSGIPQKEKEDLVAMISRSIIGRDLVFSSPFGARTTVYCDYTASGKSLTFIEDYIRDQVLVSEFLLKHFEERNRRQKLNSCSLCSIMFAVRTVLMQNVENCRLDWHVTTGTSGTEIGSFPVLCTQTAPKTFPYFGVFFIGKQII